MLACLEQEPRPPRGVSLAAKLTNFHVGRGEAILYYITIAIMVHGPMYMPMDHVS